MKHAAARERARSGQLRRYDRSRKRSKFQDPDERELAISQAARIGAMVLAKRRSAQTRREDELAAMRFAPILAQLCKAPLRYDSSPQLR